MTLLKIRPIRKGSAIYDEKGRQLSQAKVKELRENLARQYLNDDRQCSEAFRDSYENLQPSFPIRTS